MYSAARLDRRRCGADRRSQRQRRPAATGDGVDQRHGAVLARRVGERDVDERGARRPPLVVLQSSFSPRASRSMRTKSPPAATSRTWKPSAAGPCGTTATPSNRHGPLGRLDHVQLGVAEPGLAAVAAQQQVDRDAPDRLLGQHDHLAPLPVVRAGVEGGRLAPERRAVGVDQVEVERVVRSPASRSRPRPCSRPWRRSARAASGRARPSARRPAGPCASAPLSQTERAVLPLEPLLKACQPSGLSRFSPSRQSPGRT